MKPSCYAAALILADRNREGQIKRSLVATENRTYAQQLALDLLLSKHAWKESELYQ